MTIHSYSHINSNGVCFNGKPLWQNTIGLSINDQLREIYNFFHLEYSKFTKMDALCKLAFLSTEVTLKNLPQLKLQYTDYECGVVLSNASSSLETDKAYWESTKQIPSPSLFVCTLPNIALAEICIRHKFKGENNFLISKQFNTKQLYSIVDSMLNFGNMRFALCGWVELLGNKFESMLLAVEKEYVSELSQKIPFNEKEIENIFNQ